MASPYYSGGSGGIYPGVFNAQSMFNQLNNYKPDENDGLHMSDDDIDFDQELDSDAESVSDEEKK